MPYAILRFEKLKSTGAISTAQKHNERERETPNADKEIENIVIHGVCVVMGRKIHLDTLDFSK